MSDEECFSDECPSPFSPITQALMDSYVSEEPVATEVTWYFHEEFGWVYVGEEDSGYVADEEEEDEMYCSEALDDL